MSIPASSPIPTQRVPVSAYYATVEAAADTTADPFLGISYIEAVEPASPGGERVLAPPSPAPAGILAQVGGRQRHAVEHVQDDVASVAVAVEVGADDGDLFDSVLHVYNAGTATLTNVGLAVADASTIAVSGDRVAFLTSEAAQNNTTLNSDLDALDYVLQVYDAAALTLTNTGRQSESDFRFDGQVLAFRVRESAEGDTSFNPDPDAADRVAHIYCLPGATCAAAGLTNLALTAESINLAGDLVTIGVSERRMGGGDLNGDGDRGDNVLHVRHLSTGMTVNTGKAGFRGTYKISGNSVVFRIPERGQGKTDLNGDGDIRDLVVNVYDAATTITTNTGRSVQRNCLSQPVAVAEGCFGVRGDSVILFTRERDQGRTDLNGDMDVRDRVIEHWRLSTATLSSSGTAAFLRGSLALGTTIAAFRRSERQERLDLNGDGDKRDLVLAVYDSDTLMVTALLNAEVPFLIEGDTVVLRTREGVEASDLNGDTDFDDGILQYQEF